MKTRLAITTILVVVVAAETWGHWSELLAGTALLIAVAVTVPRQPALALAVGASSTLLALAGPPGTRMWPVIVCAVGCYPAGRLLNRDRAAAVTFATVAAAGLLLAGLSRGVWAWFDVMVPLLVGGLLPWFAGRYQRLRADLVESGWRRADRLAAEQRLVAYRERARIARDMHDSLGHDLGLIAMRAGALELDRGLADEHRTSAAALRAAAVEATDRLHAIIGILAATDDPAADSGAARDNGAAADSIGGAGAGADSDAGAGSGAAAHRGAGAGRVAGMDSLAGADRVAGTDRVAGADRVAGTDRVAGADSGAGAVSGAGADRVAAVDGARSPGGAGSVAVMMLIDRCRAAGMNIDADLGVELPAGVEQIVYRTLREALTNAARHAPGAPVTVRIETTGTGDRVTVDVRNGPGGPTTTAGSGLGLAALDERITAVGGTLATGPAGDGFRLTAGIPVPEPATAADGPVDHLAAARRRTRGRLAVAAAVPIGILGTVAGTLLVMRLYEVQHSTLDPSVYALLQPGQFRAEVSGLLPPDQVEGRPEDVVEPAVPDGAQCEYYRVTAELFAGPIDVYRLCFAGDRLVAKDLIPGEAP